MAKRLHKAAEASSSMQFCDFGSEYVQSDLEMDSSIDALEGSGSSSSLSAPEVPLEIEEVQEEAEESAVAGRESVWGPPGNSAPKFPILLEFLALLRPIRLTTTFCSSVKAQAQRPVSFLWALLQMGVCWCDRRASPSACSKPCRKHRAAQGFLCRPDGSLLVGSCPHVPEKCSMGMPYSEP